MEIGSLIRELGKSGRLEIIKSLRKSAKMVSELEVERMTSSTLSRTLSKLAEYDIIKKENGKCMLTGFGVAVEKLLTSIEGLFELRHDIIDLQEFLEMLPPGFIAGFHNLRNAEVISIEKALEIGVSSIANAKRQGLYIDKVISYSLYRLMAEKNLEGVEERVISNYETIMDRTSTLKKVLIDMDLKPEEYDLIAEKVQIRILDTPIQLGVIDGSAALLQLNDTLDRFYYSRDKNFVRWCEYLFWYLWEKAEIVDIRKLVEEIKEEKGLI